MYYPRDYDANISEHSGKLKVLENLLGNIKTHTPGEHVVVIKLYSGNEEFLIVWCSQRRPRGCVGPRAKFPRGMGGKNRRALLAGNVKQLQEIRLNEDLLFKI